jgi:hypothetical protein
LIDANHIELFDDGIRVNTSTCDRTQIGSANEFVNCRDNNVSDAGTGTVILPPLTSGLT